MPCFRISLLSALVTLHADHSVDRKAPATHRQLLMLAKSKHQEAMALLGTPDRKALLRLREVLRLFEEVELLADDATSYVEADVMKAAIKGLHFQQAAVQAAIARLENVKVQSPWVTAWPWLTLIVLALLLAQAMT